MQRRGKRDVPFMACLADWLVSAVEMRCANFMSELSKRKLSSQLTFAVPKALTSSHDKHRHCIAWVLLSPFQWKRIACVILAPLLRYRSMISERSVGGSRASLASLRCISLLIKLLTKTVSCWLSAQWKRKWRTSLSPTCIQLRSVSSYWQLTMLSEKDLGLEKGWTTAISSLELV